MGSAEQNPGERDPGGRDLRQALIEAASTMLQQRREAPAPSLRAVARACNVSATAVYLRFDSWSALIDAVLEQHFSGAREQVDSAAADSTDPLERTHAVALAYVNWGLANPGPYQLLFESIHWLKQSGGVQLWMEELARSMAHDLTALHPNWNPAAAAERVDQLLIALHGIVTIGRVKGISDDNPDFARKAADMVDIFTAPDERLSDPTR